MMLYDVLWCCMMLYDVIAVDFIAELCVFQLNAKLKPSYIPRCGIFSPDQEKVINICWGKGELPWERRVSPTLKILKINSIIVF